MSTSQKRSARLAVVVVLVGIGVIGYAFRSRLARAPGVERFLALLPAKVDERGPSPTQGGNGQPSDARERGAIAIDPRRQQLIGVRTAVVERASIAQSIRTIGRVRYDETRLADVNLKLEGWIRDLYVDYTGQLISKGQPLFTIYSPEMLSTENEFLLALKTREQLQQSQIADARIHAGQLVEAARQRLQLWDLPPEQIKALEDTRQAQPTVTFTSPADGFVIEKQAVKGMHVTPGQTLYKVADLSVVWVEADVYENEIRGVRVGARATVTIDAYPAERFAGRAIYVYPTVDETTRTVKVRLELANRAGRLKPGMYANVELNETNATGLVVPTNAVLDSGREQVVFVAQGDGYFEPRRVKLGHRLQDTIEIVEGVKEGEQVATGATFFLDSESQLRASLQGYESAPGGAASPAAREQLDIVLRTQPDPPRNGDNLFEATVKDTSGKPIADADVSVQLFMAAMPTMNMPEMRSQVKLQPAGGGVYRGTGEVMSPGRWDVTVSVTRGRQNLGSRQVALVAR